MTARSRSIVAGAAAVARVAAPWVKRGAQASARGARSGLRWTWRHRSGVVSVAARAGWWGALALLLRHGRALLDLHGALDPAATLAGFVWGAALCLPLVVRAEHRGASLAAISLCLLHVAGALLLHHAMA